ncbi:MAG: NnrS family protein [Betaproteobacteria bacterium]
MKFSEQPLWLVGFRPFFVVACVAGMLLPVIWAMMFSGQLASPVMPFSMIQWHAHEMLYGFGWAVLGGFMLTSTKNWVKIRGYHGSFLILLVFLWLIERGGMWFSGRLPSLVFAASNNLFLVTIVAMLLWTLLRHRAEDSFRTENWAFLIILPAFLVAKQLLLSEYYFAAGSSMAIGLFRMAFIVMLERTLGQFMKNAFQVSILRHALLDRSIKLLALVFVMESFLPRMLAASVALLLAMLLLLRLVFWKPMLAMRRLDLGIMYLGCMAIIAQLVIEFINAVVSISWVGSVSVHVFTFGAMGLIIPAMLIRICNGHTGRKVVFGVLDKLVLWIMMAAFLARVVLPQFFPADYLLWIDLAAVFWLTGFGLLAWRYIPFLMAARVDGKEH